MKHRHRPVSRSRQRRQFLGIEAPSSRRRFGRTLRFERLENRALLTVVVGMDDGTGLFTIRDTDGPDSDVAIDGAEDFSLENNDVTLSFAQIDVPDLNPLAEPGLLVTDPAGVVAGEGAFQISPDQAFIPRSVTTVDTFPVLTPVVHIDLQAGDDNVHFANNFALVPTVTTVNVHGGDNGSNDLLILDGTAGAAEHVSMALPFNATEVTAIAGYAGVTINARGAEIIEYRAAGGDDELLLQPFFGTSMRIDSASNAVTDRAVSDGLPEVQWSNLDRFTIQPGGIQNAYDVTFDLPELIAANFYQVDVLSAGPAIPDPVTVTVLGNGGANGFVVKDPGVGEFQVSTPENGGRPLTAIDEDVALLRLETGGGDDDVTIDVGNGLLSVPIVYDGGEGSDRLSIVGAPPAAVDEVFYLPGPATTEGRLRYENAANAALMTVDFANLEPVIDLVPAATLTVAGTGSDNAISYGPGATPASGVVRVDEFETIEFSNKGNLLIAAGPGTDTITLNNPLTPAGLTGVSVIGGDPSTSDVVVVHGTSGADTIIVTPTADGGSVQVNASPPVTLSSIEQLVIDGDGGNDSLTVVGSAAGDTIIASPGSARDAGSVGISGSLSVGFQNLGGGGTVTVDGGGGTDTLIAEGTSADDTLSVAAGGAVTVNGQIAVNQTAVERLELRGLSGDDTFNLVANHGYGAVTIEGGSDAGDSVFLTSVAAETVTVRPSNSDASRQAVAGFGGTVNIGGSEQIVYLGSGTDDTLIVSPGPVGSSRIQNSPSDSRGRITSDTLPIVEWNALETFRLSHGGNTSTRVDTFVLEDLFDATGFEYHGTNDSLVVEGGASDNDWTIARSGGNVVITSATGLGVGELTVLAGFPDEIRFDTLAGNDTLTVDNSGGLITVPIVYQGGDGSDRLELVGSTAVDASEYTPGATSDAGVVAHTLGTVTETISFTGLEPVLDLAPAAELIVNGTGGDNAINYTQGATAASGLVSVDGFETIEFSNKTTLTINGLAGSDTINLNNPATPTGLTGITVSGGDPTASDTLIVNGAASVNDELNFDPTGVGAGTVSNDAGGPDVGFTGIEGLILVVQDADGDEAEVNGTIGNDTFEFISGLTPDTFVLIGTMDQNNATGAGPFALVPTTVKGGDVTDDVDINFGAVGGTDSFIFNATAGNDIIAAGLEVGDILITNTINGQLVASVDVDGITSAMIRGHDGDDAMSHDGSISIPVAYDGGNPSASDVLDFAGTGGLITIDTALQTITESGFGPVSYSGIEHINVDAAGGAVDINGSLDDDAFTVRPNDATGAEVTLAGHHAVFQIENTLDLEIDGNNGAGLENRVTVIATEGADDIAVSGATVSISGRMPVNLVDIQQIDVLGVAGNDAFNVTPSDTATIFIDGGDPIGTVPGDSLTVNGALGLVHPGPESDEGGFLTTGQTVSFDHIEELIVSPDADCPFLIVGTSGDDDITIIARDGSTHAGADGLRDFTFSINQGPEILVLNAPDLFIDAGSGDDDIVIRAPAGDISLWGVNIRVAGGPPSIGETNEADRLVLETPGHDNLVFTPTGPDTGTLLVDELINGTFDEGIDTLITLGSFVYVCPDIDFTYTSSPGGVELVEYDGELPLGGALPTDEITIAGTAASDVTTLDPTFIGAGSFASGFSPLFHFRSYGQVTANAGGGGFDRVVVNGTEGADSISSGTTTITGLNAFVVIGAEVDQLELNALGGNDTVDLNLTVAGLQKVVNAGVGNDVVDMGGTTDATIYGGAGNDLLTGSSTRDHIDGGAGDDVLFGFGAADTLHGGEGNDMIVGGASDDFAYGGAGSDTFVWNPGDADDLFEGDGGDDTLAFAGANGTDSYVISSNNGRVIFQRQPGNVGVNMGGVENIVANSETVQLSGRNEVPANTSPASGFANFTYSEATGTFDIRMFVTGLTSPIVDSHIHMSVPGSNGPVVVPFGAGFVPVAGGFELTAVGLSLASIVPPAGFTAQDVLMEILLGRAYFNVHTINFPGGEVRGNIIAPSGPTAGSGGGDSLEVRDTTGAALRNIVFDAGNEAEIRNGAALVDTVVVQGLDISDAITASVPNVLDNSYVVAGLPYRIVVNGSDGNPANAALRDQFTLNGNGGDDLLKAQPPLENISRVTLDGGVGDDFLSADAILIGGPGDDFLEGGAGDDTLSGGPGEDTLVGGGGSDTFDGGADFDTVLVSGTSGNDIITANQTAPTTLVTTLNGVIDTDTLVTVAGVRTVERVRIEAGSGDDTIFVMHVDSLGLSAEVDSVLFDVDGGSAQTRDRLSVQDNGIGDLILYRKGDSDSAGSISVGPGNAESLENVFENVEFIQPIAGADGQLLVFKHDPYENNDERINATHLGAGETINVDPNIDPGPLDAPDPFTDLPGDQDWYRIVADRTGTLDIQVYFAMIASVASGRPGLPDGGNLDIELYDADGLPIAIAGTGVFGTNDADDNERIRIPAVAGQVYFLRVFGAGAAINNYSITTVNAAAAIPFDLELDDSPVNGTTNPPGQSDNSDTGRSQNDNITYDTTPTIFLRLPDVVLAGIAASLDDVPASGGAPGSPVDETILIPHVTSTDTDAPSAGFRVAIFVTENDTSDPVLAGYAQPVAGRPGVFTYTFTTALSPDGSYFINARVEMIDPAAPQQAQGFGEFGQSLEIFVDIEPPPVSFGLPGVAGDGLFPDSDSGVAGCDGTFDDNVTTDAIPAFWGTAEADAVIRVFLDTNANGVFDATDLQVGFDVAEPLDGTNQYPSGHWELQTTVNLNDDDLFPVIDGLRRFFVTAEDVAGNLNPGDPNDVQVLDLFLDTQGPQVTDVDINTAGNPYDLFNPKPSVDGPTPLVQQLVISIQDLPERVAGFLFDALCVEVAENPGHYQVRGDYNGIIPIHEVIVELDPEVAGEPATGTITLVFWDFGGDGVPFTLDDVGGPLRDDRYTLMILDSLVDPAGNNLDGESNASEPQPNGLVDVLGVDGIPSGDGVPGGNFVARFTIDSVAEVGTWGAGSAWIDTNGNTSFDPANEDFTNRDITYILGLTSDDLFAGNFALNPGDTADGFDKLAAYGRINGVWRWLVDTDNDGVPNVSQPDARAINGLPVAGNFDGDAANGDEVGLFTGTTWWLDTDHDFQVDTSIVAAAGFVGLPIVGDFDGDGQDDLAAWADDRFTFDLSADGIDGGIDAQFRFGPIGPNERPIAADVNGDGLDDLGLFVPNRAGAAPDGGAEWYVLMTGEVRNNTQDVPPGEVVAPASLGPTIIDRIVTDPVDGQAIVRFTPKPFGRDVFVTYGDEFSLPLLGNFDPPVSSSTSIPNPANNTRDPLDVNNDGRISPVDALLVINHLNRFGPTILTSGGFQRAPFLDVNNNNQVSPIDALMVINYLNAQLSSTSSTAEGEADQFFSELGESSQSSGDEDVLAALANDQENQRRKR